MYLVRRNESPWFKDVEDTFNDLFTGLTSAENVRHHQFAIDVLENDTNYLVELDIPGLEREDIKLHFEDNILTINAKKELSASENLKYLKQERRFGEFKRSLKLVKDIDAQNISADLKNGVLKITLPKSVKEAAKAIEIKVH